MGMAIVRAVKNKEYSVISNKFLNDPDISFKAKGILCYCLSRPDHWVFYTSEIKKHCKDGLGSVTSGINELIEHGYIKRTSTRDEKGRYNGGYDYLVYEEPNDLNNLEVDNPKLEKPKLDNPKLEKPKSENCILVNTDIKANTDYKENTELKQLLRDGCGSFKNEEIYEFYLENDFGKLTKGSINILDENIEKYSKETVKEAMVEAIKRNKQNISYVEGILRNKGKKTKGGSRNGEPRGGYEENLRGSGLILGVEDL